MDAKDLRILFMGTPEFAVASLKALVEGGYNIAAVVTMPDKPSGRGLKMNQSAVKVYAHSVGLRVLQPEKLRDEGFIEELKGLNLDLGVVIAFRMLPEVVWSMPRLGTFNLHGSLLPQYRGAAPINWAIINGDIKTGVTTFMLNHEIDKGDVVARAEVDILSDDTAGVVHDKLMELGAKLVILSVNELAGGEISALPQIDSSELRPAPKIFKDDCLIDWRGSTKDIYNFIRGLSPHPSAWSRVRWGQGDNERADVKIFFAHSFPVKHNREIGSVDSDGKKYINIYCSDGYLSLSELQFSGKRRMSTEEFLRGFMYADSLQIEM